MKRLFIYNAVNTSAIADLASFSDKMTLSSDSGFMLTEIRTTGTAKVKVSLKYATGELFSTTGFDAGIIGAGQNRLALPEPVQFDNNAVVEYTFLNKTGSTIPAENFELEFIGYKL
jgi:hypothetical protein